MNNVKDTLSVKKYIFSYIIATVITLSVMGICAVIFSFFPPGEKMLDISCIVYRCFSAFLAAFLCARVTKRKGLVTGVISALVYEILIVLPSMLIHFDFSLMELCVLMAQSAVSGAIGGILAINLK